MVSRLSILTIYDRPSDFPDMVVVREWRVGPGWTSPNADVYAYAEDVEGARMSIPDGCHRIDRSPTDEQQIVESWIWIRESND